MSELTQEKLKQILSYDPETGIFIWKNCTSSTRSDGEQAGYLHATGYVRIHVSGSKKLAHRLAWLYVEGYIPVGYDIDHIDRNRANNKFSNLRLTSRKCNIRNSSSFKSNTSGIKGVSWQSRDRRWKASICCDGKDITLGNYIDLEDAACARLAGEQALNWSGCDSCSPAYQYVKKMLGK